MRGESLGRPWRRCQNSDPCPSCPCPVWPVGAAAARGRERRPDAARPRWRRSFRRRTRSRGAAPAQPRPRASAVFAPRPARARSRATARRDSSWRRAVAKRRRAERAGSAAVRHRRAPGGPRAASSAPAFSPRRVARAPPRGRMSGSTASAARRGRSIRSGRAWPDARPRPLSPLALAGKKGARRMAREAPRQPRRPQRALVDAPRTRGASVSARGRGAGGRWR